MRQRLINYLKVHPKVIRTIWSVARCLLGFLVCISKQKKTILFCSFGGRNFSDSPKAIYDEICHRDAFNDWRLIWAFVDSEKFEIPRGEKVKVDTLKYFKELVTSKIWVSNSGMDRGIDLITNKIIRVETWHGTPLKKIGGEENQNSFGIKPEDYDGPIDATAIRCAQSEFDRDIFSRIFHATKNSFLVCDLPRNDEIVKYTINRLEEIKCNLGIDLEKKVILYTPTYREYLIDENKQNFFAPPMNLKKWEEKLADNYVLLIRAHYAVSAALKIKENAFVKDVSKYPNLNDLYAISDMMISDYSSTFFDYAILDRPMFCFAYDQQEYEEKRGLYLDLNKDLPCSVDKDEDALIEHIINIDYEKASQKTKAFHQKYSPYAGKASTRVVDEILIRLSNRNT